MESKSFFFFFVAHLAGVFHVLFWVYRILWGEVGGNLVVGWVVGWVLKKMKPQKLQRG